MRVLAETLTGSSMPESAALAQFNKSWAELTDWLTMLDKMVQNKRVVVADLDDINDNISKLKVFIHTDWIYDKTVSKLLWITGSLRTGLCKCRCPALRVMFAYMISKTLIW